MVRMTNHITTEIVSNGKTLILFTTNLRSYEVPGYIAERVTEAFEKLSEFMIEDTQVLYIRDIPELCIDGEYPYSYCSNSREAMIAIRKWGLGLNMEHFTVAVYKELFQMARLQNAGSSGTLGDAIFSEGAATYFAKLMSGMEPPFAGTEVTKRMRRAAVRRWDSRFFNFGRWFYEGRRGKWVGYAIGYELAEARYSRGVKSEVKDAVSADASHYKWLVRDFNRF